MAEATSATAWRPDEHCLLTVLRGTVSAIKIIIKYTLPHTPTFRPLSLGLVLSEKYASLREPGLIKTLGAN